MKDRFQATRRSLLGRLGNLGDQRSWQVFFDTYWKLIYSVARKAGLNEFEAEEVVQETVISVSRNIGEFRYDPAIGSFKSWLLTTTRWRIQDQFRKRNTTSLQESDEPVEAALLEKLWAAEWEDHVLQAALTRLKDQVDPRQFQIFDCYVIKGWAPLKVAAELGVKPGAVYLAKNRILPLLKEIVALIEKEGG
jgi:RNA polymerase sigma factor (sigma-70 family)